jgi:ATP-dependent DNA ligase
MGKYKEEGGVWYWETDSGKKIPVDLVAPSTRMRRDLFRPFITRAMKLAATYKIQHGNPITTRAKQWKKDQGIVSLSRDELEKKIRDENLQVHAGQKVDGQNALLEYKDGKARFGSQKGSIIAEIPILEEIEGLFKREGISSAQIMGELAGAVKGRVLPFRESASLIKNRSADKSKLHWYPYQILELDGVEFKNDFENFTKAWPRLQNLFKGAKHIHPVKVHQGGVDALKKAWNQFVERENHEGIVVRTSDNKVYKVKPEYTYDLVVVAVGDKKGKNWPKKRIGNTLMAFMDKDGVFRVAGEVGTGWTEEEGKELFQWAQKNKVDEDDTYVWVKPRRVMEVRYERSNIKEMPSYKYSGGKYVEDGKKEIGTIVKPRFVRWRDDKSANPEDLRLTQIPDWQERKAEGTPKPLSFNKFMIKHTEIMINDPASDNHFPPQRALMLYEKYKKELKKGNPKALQYHQKAKKVALAWIGDQI